MKPLRSCIYRGKVRHRRLAPTRHEFSFSLYMLALDLEELDRVFRGRWLWSVERANVVSFRRRDFLGDPGRPLIEAVRDKVEAVTGRRPEGRAVLVTNLRQFGLSFNPVSFYYCHDADGRVAAVVGEITNTPWLERHSYVLEPSRPEGGAPGGGPDEGGRAPMRFRFAKDFHVSPFMGMDQEYDWTFAAPGERLLVHMQNHEDGERIFDATLDMARRPLTGPQLARCLVAHPFITGKVLAGIYWHALRLRLKGTPFHPHPAVTEPVGLAAETRS